MWTSGFHRNKKVYTYRRQSTLGRKLCKFFGQLLLTYWKDVEHGIEHDIDWAYGVCMH